MSRVRLFAALAASVLAAAALGTVSIPAQADTIVASDPDGVPIIVTNQWYTASFSVTAGGPLFVVGAFGTNGPILPSGTANALAAPGPVAGNLSAVITLPNGGFLTATDVAASGDRFMMEVNGIGATAAVGNPTGLTPGGQQAVGSDTSVPVGGADCGSDISCSLSNPDFSSGTFALPAGTDTISGTVVAALHPGSMDFIVEPKSATVPEPATWLLLSSALVGFGVVRRRNRSA
jgi:hypothetical protein